MKVEIKAGLSIGSRNVGSDHTLKMSLVCENAEMSDLAKIMVREIGLKMYYTRADRTVRQWVKEGRLQRLTVPECRFRGLWQPGQQHIAWYEV